MWAKFLERLAQFRENSVYLTWELFHYTHTKVYIGLALATNLFLWLFVKYIVSAIGEERIALHYTVDFGIDYYGAYEKIYILPLLGLLLIGLNMILAVNMARSRDIRLVSHILLASALTANLLLVAAAASVYLINTR